MKVVINRCFGGFNLSDKAINWLKSHGACADSYKIKRNDPCLVECVETLGLQANGDHAYLRVVEIPDGIEWEIEEYDGNEWVSEQHRIWE